MAAGWRDWARTLRADVITLYLVARDPRVPWHAKALAAFVAAYALSPIDIIPDFIPVLGLLDDLIVVPLGVYFVIKLVPKPLLVELRQKAEAHSDEPRASWMGAALVLAIWLLLAAVFVAILFPGFRPGVPVSAAA